MTGGVAVRMTGGVYMSAGEVAARLGVPVRTVLDLAGRGALPSERRQVGARRFRWSEVVVAWRSTPPGSGPGRAVDALADDVGVARVAGNFLDQVQ